MSDAATTLRSVLLVAALVALAQIVCVAGPWDRRLQWQLIAPMRRAYQQLYEDWLMPLAGFRLAEALIAVTSFALSAFTFKAIQFAGFKKMGHTVASRGQIISEKAAMFIFWTAANIGIYLGVIDIFQRVFHDSLEELDIIVTPPTAPPSPVRLVTEVAFSVWCYDFLFFWIHRSFHIAGASSKRGADQRQGLWEQLQTWWHGVHLTHHDHYSTASEPLHVLVTFHHHILDATLQVGINIVVQQIPLLFLWPGKRHIVSKFVHNIVVTYLLVEAHSGFDLPFMSHRLFPSLFGGSVRHQQHHHSGRKYFHQFFRYLDDAIGPLQSQQRWGEELIEKRE